MNRKLAYYMVSNVETGELRKLRGDSLLREDCLNFKVYEFVSTDKSEIVLYSPRLVNFLQRLRDKFGRAVIITSGNREILYNIFIKGYEDSEHLYGLAVDIKMYGIGMQRLYNACVEIGGYFCNVGLYSTHVHFGIKGFHRRV